MSGELSRATPPLHLSNGAADYLVSPDVLEYPSNWTDAWSVQEFRDFTEPLWCGLNDAITTKFRATEDTIAGVPVQRVVVGKPKPSMAIVHLHGGMYCLGSPSIDLAINVPLAQQTGIEIVSVDYRLAPEYPFPAALDDAVAVHQTLTDAGVTTAVFGESAGGGLAAALVLALRDGRQVMPNALALLSPMLDLTGGSDTFKTLAPHDPDYFDTQVLLAPAAAYAAETPLDHPMLSPIYAELDGLPPTLVQVGNREVLLGDSTRFAQRARRAGVDVVLDVQDGGWHNYPIWHGVAEADAAVARLATFITKETDA